MRTLLVVLTLSLAPFAAGAQQVVSTAGSPYVVVLEDGTVVSSHSQQHTATAAALLISASRGGETVYVRRSLELRVTAARRDTIWIPGDTVWIPTPCPECPDPVGPVEPDPEPPDEPGVPLYIEMEPATVEVAIGESTTVVARVYDADGTLVPVSLDWRAHGHLGGAVTVTDGGVITGTRAGSALVTVRWPDGDWFDLPVTVLKSDPGPEPPDGPEPPPPTPPGDYEPRERYPNEPAGFVPWFEHDWQTWPEVDRQAMMASGAGMVRLGPPPAANSRFVLVDDPDAPHGKGKSLRHRLAQGTANGSSSGTFDLYSPKAGAGTSVSYADQVKLRSVYRSHWVFLEPDPVTGDFMFGNRHMRSFWWNRRLGAARGGNISLTSPSTSVGGYSQRADSWRGVTHWYIETVPLKVIINGGSKTLALGQWYHIETLWETQGKYNSAVTETNYSNNDDEAGINDGARFRAWINGELVVDNILSMHVRAPLANDHFSMVFLGGSGAIREQDDFIRFGDIYVSGRVETW